VKKTSNVNNIPKEIVDYLDFLGSTDEARNKIVTKSRIDKNFDKFGQAINTFLTYPDKVVDLMTPKASNFNLYFSQRITLRAMARHRQSYHTYTRGFSKSFLAFLSRYIGTMLVPRHKAFIVAGTKMQAANIAKEKVIDDLWVKFPLLANEMQKFRIAGKLQEAYIRGKDYAEFRFTHGGIFDVIGSGSGIRGARRHSGIFEEVIEHDPTEINERIIPLMNKERNDSFGKVNPHEPHGNKIFVTTAGYQGTYAYEKLIESVCYAVIDPERYMVLGGSYEIPLMHGLLDEQAMREVISSPTFEQDSMDREYKSIWSGSPVGAAFTAKRIQELRKVVRAETKSDKESEDYFYIVSADMAKDGSANTAVVVLKVYIRPHAFLYTTVNMFQIETTDYEEVSRELKRTVIDYEATLLIYDAQGIGAAIRDWLNKPQLDPGGIVLPAYGIINPPTDSKKDIRKTSKDKTICYEIKSTGEKGSKIHKIFFSKIGSGNLRFLIKHSHAVERFSKHKKFMEASNRKKKSVLRPYQYMDVLEEEMKNLDIVDVVDNLNMQIIRVKRRNQKIQKDFFSAAEYGVYGVHEHLEVPYFVKKRKKKNSPSDFILSG